MGELITIPEQLKDMRFRFLLLRKKNKEPIEKLWESENNYLWNDSKLQNHLKKGFNYGIIGGYGYLALIDSDSQEVDDIAASMPETFTVNTGSPEKYKKHYFFITDKPLNPIRLSKEKIGDLGDIRTFGQYVVAPNSLHPKGGKYEVIKDLPIKKIKTDEFVSYFQSFIDKEIKEDKIKKYKIITSKRIDPYIDLCLVPDYLLNHRIQGNTSKNWELFKYVVDILYNRKVSNDIILSISDKQGHSSGAIKGWINYAKSGKLEKSSCEKMFNYIRKYHPNLLNILCYKCKNYKNQLSEAVDSITNYTDFFDLSDKFIKLQPMFFDSAKNIWLWDFNNYCWKIVDEFDLMNKIDDALKNKPFTVNSKVKNEIMESLKRAGRRYTPKSIKKYMVQFNNKIYDFETGDSFDATPKFFVTNPIPWDVGESIETPVMDSIFESWVGKDYVDTLYEIIAYSCLPSYPLHRIFCLIGSGLNGKGKFLSLLSKFIGDANKTSSDLDILLKSRFECSKLYKKLVCLMGETNFDGLNRTSMLKRLTGEDLIGFEFKHKSQIDDVNYAKIIIATNSLPTTTDKTVGFYRRWMIIDFPNSFNEKKDILDEIPDYEYNNLANKCIHVLKKIIVKREFTNEGSIEERKKAYEDKSNPLDKFLRENTVRDSNEFIYKYDFKDRFEVWLGNNGYRLWNPTEIGIKMKELFEDGRKQSDYDYHKQVWCWLGLKWKEKENV